VELLGYRTILALRSAAALGLVVYAAAAGVAALAEAGESSWAAEASVVCRAWNDKAAALVGAPAHAPVSLAAMFGYLTDLRPLEAGELHDIQALAGTRPAGAATALRSAASDLRRLDAALGAYRAGDSDRFVGGVSAWRESRTRTRDALRPLGCR
jgi:hypothetical protein